MSHTAQAPAQASMSAADATALITRARNRLLLQKRWSFFAQLSLRLILVCDHNEPTMATDGTSLFYNPKWVGAHPLPIQESAIAHEVLHCALRHVWRLSGRDHALANIAADHAVNLVLLDCGFTLWRGALADKRFAGMSFEQIYAILDKERRAQAPQTPTPAPQEEDTDGEEDGAGDGEEDTDESDDDDGEEDGADGEGAEDDGEEDGDSGADGEESDDESNDDDSSSGADDGEEDAQEEDSSAPATDGEEDGAGDDGGDDGDIEQPGGMRPPPTPTEPTEGKSSTGADKDSQELAWALATEQAALKSRNDGSIGEALNRLMVAANKEEDDIWEVLRQYVQALKPTNYSWAQPNRRFVSSGLYLPGIVKESMPGIGIAVDTSGSIDNEMLKRFAVGLNMIVEDYQPEYIEIVYCDDSVRRTVRFEQGEEVELSAAGGGGTAFQPALNYYSNLEEVPALVIYLTDLYGENVSGYGPIEPEYPVIWVTTECSTIPAPFGERLTMTQHS